MASLRTVFLSSVLLSFRIEFYKKNNAQTKFIYPNQLIIFLRINSTFVLRVLAQLVGGLGLNEKMTNLMATANQNFAHPTNLRGDKTSPAGQHFKE